MTIARPAGAAFGVLLLAGCAGGQYSLTDKPAQSEGVGMPGRWMLAAPNAPACGMNFTGADGAREGRVTPDGGCPGRFFLSRRWTLSGEGLTILDPDGEALAQLKPAEARFEGKAATGMPVTLTRAVAPPG
jgi:hypothetical protein